MRIFTKIFLTFFTLVIWDLINNTLNQPNGNATSNTGLISILFFIGMIIAIRAIWKWKPEQEKKDTSIDEPNDKSNGE